MKLIRCDACDGTGKVLALGGMKIDCLNCKGLRFVSSEAVRVAAKRGRPFSKPVENNGVA